MHKLIRYIQNYLVYGFLPVVGLIIWSIFIKQNISESNLLVRTIHEILSYNMMIWFVTFIFLFFSMFNFHYSKLEKSSPDKPGHSVGIGFGYRLFAETVTDKQTVKGVSPIFDSTSYALSGSTLLLILLAWQLLFFNLSARKLSK